MAYRRINDAWQVRPKHTFEELWEILHATDECWHVHLRLQAPAVVHWPPVPSPCDPWVCVPNAVSHLAEHFPVLQSYAALQWQRAIRLLELMWQIGGELCPDIVSYNTVIKACGNAGQVGGGRQRDDPTVMIWSNRCSLHTAGTALLAVHQPLCPTPFHYIPRRSSECPTRMHNA